MNTLEDRLRDAYQAAAQTVRPESVLPEGIRGVHDREPRAWPGERGRSGGRLLIPLAAAAAVIGVVAGTTVLARHTMEGPAGARGHRNHAMPAAGTPRFFVAMNWTSHPSMFVVNAATGAKGVTIGLPFPAKGLTGLATGDGHTFVVGRVQAGCRTQLYRFRLSPAGQPTRMTKVATVPGAIASPWDLAVAKDSQTVAFDTGPCEANPTAHHRSPASWRNQRDYLTVLNTATGQMRRWTYSLTGHGYESLGSGGDVSLSADGRTVAFEDWTLPTDAPDGPLLQRARVVARNGEFGAATALGATEIAPDGKTVYFDTFAVRNDKPVMTSWQLRALDLATGQTRLVRNLPGEQGTPAAVTPDPTGRYLLIDYTQPKIGPGHLLRYDVATGQVTELNASWAEEAAIAW